MRIDVTRLTYANAHPYYRSYYNAKSIPFQIPLHHICNIAKNVRYSPHRFHRHRRHATAAATHRRPVPPALDDGGGAEAWKVL